MSAFTVANDYNTSVIALKKTFSERKGTVLEELHTDDEKVRLVVTLLAYGYPLQAIVHTFGLDERTVAAWQKHAGTHGLIANEFTWILCDKGRRRVIICNR